MGGFELSWTEPGKEEGESEAPRVPRIGSESRVLGIGGAQGFHENGRGRASKGVARIRVIHDALVNRNVVGKVVLSI